MTECGTNIVDCLKSKGINPVATGSSEQYPASNALIYVNKEMFHTFGETDLWWKVDFKQIVTIHSYQIETYNYCAHIKTWNISVSNDNRYWRVADFQPEDGFPCGRNYTMNRISSARYLKVNKIKDSECNNFFAMIYIKFFGSINGVLPGKQCTVINKRTIYINIMNIVFIMVSR